MIKLSNKQKHIMNLLSDGYILRMGNGAFLVKDTERELVNRNSVWGLNNKKYIKFHSKRDGTYYGYFTLTIDGFNYLKEIRDDN